MVGDTVYYVMKQISMKKINLNDLTICIPVRIDSVYRTKNLLAVLKFYNRYLSTNFKIIEADKECHLNKLPNIDGLTYEYIYDANPIFHKTYYINYLLASISTPFAAIWDTDVIAPVSQINEAYHKIKDGKTVMTFPYSGYVWALDVFFSSCFCRNLSIDMLLNYPMPRSLMHGYACVGGAYLVNVDLYKKYGWENEYIKGWGPEDSEHFKRLHILGQRPVRISGPLFHLFHSRGINSGNLDKSLALQTRKEYCHVCNMLPDELKEYVNTWEWIK